MFPHVSMFLDILWREKVEACNFLQPPGSQYSTRNLHTSYIFPHLAVSIAQINYDWSQFLELRVLQVLEDTYSTFLIY
jgi:hypothetical protein